MSNSLNGILNDGILRPVVFEDGSRIVRWNSRNELVCGYFVECFGLFLARKDLVEVSRFLKFAGQKLDLGLLNLLLSSLSVLPCPFNFFVNLLKLFESLFDGGVQLHGVLCRVLEGLFQIGDLS